MPDIILDRDGVINIESVEYVKTPDEWHAIPGSLEAIALLNKNGFRVFIATNQSGVARQYYTIETLNLIHQKMKHALSLVDGKIEDIFFCPHHPDERCPCRKPAPGMLIQIKNKHQVDLKNTYFVGDSFVDVKAAHAAGCKSLLVLTGCGRRALENHPELQPDKTAENLTEAVKLILQEKNNDV